MCQYKEGPLQLQIVWDNDAPSPRKDMDPLGELVILNGEWKHLGDPHNYYDWDHLYQFIRDESVSGLLHYPVMVYPRMGSAEITLGKENDRHVAYGEHGQYLLPHKQLREEYKVKRVSRRVKNIARKIMEAEIDLYNQWLGGYVYGAVLQEEGETVDSLWGLYKIDLTGLQDFFSDKYCEFIHRALQSEDMHVLDYY